MSEEYWKDIPGFEGEYQASIFGMVRSCNRIVKKGRKHVPSMVKGHVLSPWIGQDGYLRVDFYRDAKPMVKKVHRLVAETFVSNPDNKETVNHIDENKLNNTAENLEWMTNGENVNYGTRVQRVKEEFGHQVVRISPSGHITRYLTLHDAEIKTGIHRQSIAYAIKHGTNLKGYRWLGGDLDCIN